MENNNIKTLEFQDTLSADKQEKIITDGTSKPRRRGPVFETDIEIYEKDLSKSVLGEDLFTNEYGVLKQKTTNELVLPGALFVAEKLINSASPIKPRTINQDLGVSTVESDPGFTGKRRENVICLFGVGTGGAGTNFDTVVPVKYSERILQGMIPMRRVPTSTDLSSAERNKYFLRKTNGGFYEYFLKKFEIDPTIHCVYDEAGNPSVPPNFDEVNPGKIINTYMQFNIKISKDDVREYFKTAGGGISKARINTLGLFIGYPVSEHGRTEYKGVQLFSKLNFNNEPLDNESKELNIIYKIYIS